MEISVTQLFIAVLISFTALSAVAFLAFRSGETLHPVFCPRCWTHEKKKTVVTFSKKKKKRWAICPECTRCYWHFKQVKE